MKMFRMLTLIILAVSPLAATASGPNTLCRANFFDVSTRSGTSEISVVQSPNRKITIFSLSAHGGGMMTIPVVALKKANLTKGMAQIDYDVMVNLLERSGVSGVLPVDFFNARYLMMGQDGGEPSLALVLVDAIRNGNLQYRFVTDMSMNIGICVR